MKASVLHTATIRADPDWFKPRHIAASTRGHGFGTPKRGPSQRRNTMAVGIIARIISLILGYTGLLICHWLRPRKTPKGA